MSLSTLIEFRPAPYGSRPPAGFTCIHWVGVYGVDSVIGVFMAGAVKTNAADFTESV